MKLSLQENRFLKSGNYYIEKKLRIYVSIKLEKKTIKLKKGIMAQRSPFIFFEIKE